MFKFNIQAKDKKSRARAGEYETAHGKIETPCFVPVGTKATVKGLTPSDLKEIGVQILFANTYHLHLRPGEDLVKEFGGVSKFMNWNSPVMTDSGGFQVFSLAKNNRRLPHVANDAHQAQEKMVSLPRSLSERRLSGSNKKETSPGSAFSSFASGQAPLEKKKVLLEPNLGVGLDKKTLKDEEKAQDIDMADLVKITNDGVSFRSHIDGSLHMFTPEVSIGIQKKLGADFILCFDECAPHPSTEKYTKEAMERTHSWAKRCLTAKQRQVEQYSSETVNQYSVKQYTDLPTADLQINRSTVLPNSYYNYQQGIYGIVQGGVYEKFRKQSAEFISSQNFDAVAIGGVSVGESKKQMRNVVDWVYPYLPEDRTRHLLGIGEIDDIFAAVEGGMDTFDCVIPTRFGRYGIAFVGPKEQEEKGRFRIDISKTKYAKDKGPIASDCSCYVCKDFTRAYIHHLFRSHELLAYRLVSYHNLYFVVNLVKKIRNAILEERFLEMKREWIGRT